MALSVGTKAAAVVAFTFVVAPLVGIGLKRLTGGWDSYGGGTFAILRDAPAREGAPQSTDPAIQAAEAKSARAFRATRVDIDAGRLIADVRSVFMVRTGQDHWDILWSTRERQDGSQERSDLEARIKNDPQVQSALGTVQSLGLTGGDHVDRAIRFGAATMAAQQSVDAKFAVVRNSLVKQLDGPPLWMDEGPHAKRE